MNFFLIVGKVISLRVLFLYTLNILNIELGNVFLLIKKSENNNH